MRGLIIALSVEFSYGVLGLSPVMTMNRPHGDLQKHSNTLGLRSMCRDSRYPLLLLQRVHSAGSLPETHCSCLSDRESAWDAPSRSLFGPSRTDYFAIAPLLGRNQLERPEMHEESWTMARVCCSGTGDCKGPESGPSSSRVGVRGFRSTLRGLPVRVGCELSLSQ
jgi:hypothetical protein